MVTRIERPHLLRLVPHLILVVDLNDAFASLNEEHIILLRPSIILLQDLVLRHSEVYLHSGYNIVEKVSGFRTQSFLLDDLLVE